MQQLLKSSSKPEPPSIFVFPDNSRCPAPASGSVTPGAPMTTSTRRSSLADSRRQHASRSARTQLVFHGIHNIFFNPMQIRVTSTTVYTRNSTVARLPPVPFWRSQFGRLSHQDQPPPGLHSPVRFWTSTARDKRSVRRSIRALRVVLALRRAAGPNSQANL
jgi:hypothetical protein